MMTLFSAKSFHWKDVDSSMLNDDLQSFFEGQGEEKGIKGHLPSKNKLRLLRTLLKMCFHNILIALYVYYL